MTFRYYRDLEPTFADRSAVGAAHRAASPRRRAPRRGAGSTPGGGRAPGRYAEMLASAERVGRNFLAEGAEQGDRVVLVAQNSSRFVRTWIGTAVAGLVEVPINTAYEHDFLAHQVRTVEARLAVVDDVFAERFVAVKEAAKDITKFWVIDTGRAGQGDRGAPRRRLGGRAVGRARGGLPAGTSVDLPDVRPQDLASVLFTSGTTGPSKGVAMPHAQMYFFADECVSLVRLTADDAWMTVTPLFHGNAQFMAAYPTLVAGARCVIRSRFSASRWIDQIRESRVTVTNFIGVMMDFIWKQDRREDDADNPLRGVFAAPTAATLVQPDEGALRDRGVRRGLRPHRDLGADHLAVRRGPAGGCGRPGGRRVVRRRARRPGDRRGGRGRRDRRAGDPAEGAVHLLDGLLQHAREDRRGVAQPVVPHRRRAAPRRGRLVLLRRPLQGRPAPPRREHQLLRDRDLDPRPPGRRRVRRDRRARLHRGRRGRGDGLRRSPRTRSPPSSCGSTATGGSRRSPCPATCGSSTSCPRRRRSACRRPSCASSASPPTPTTAPPTTAEPPRSLRVHPYRSILFVPAHKPDWARKALSSGADCLVIDLEDSVPADLKESARETAQQTLAELRTESPDVGLFVRPNALDTRMAGADLEAVVCPELTGLFTPEDPRRHRRGAVGDADRLVRGAQRRRGPGDDRAGRDGRRDHQRRRDRRCLAAGGRDDRPDVGSTPTSPGPSATGSRARAARRSTCAAGSCWPAGSTGCTRSPACGRTSATSRGCGSSPTTACSSASAGRF